MDQNEDIPYPIIFNPLKHYLPFIRNFITDKVSEDRDPGWINLIKELKHLGTSVMDIYTGSLLMDEIFYQVDQMLISRNLVSKELFAGWVGRKYNNFKIISLSDNSQWTLKYHNYESRYVHIFPSRLSPNSYRVKSNTIKSAILYLILIGKDFVTEGDLNIARSIAGLSPIKNVTETEAIAEMIEILRY